MPANKIRGDREMVISFAKSIVGACGIHKPVLSFTSAIELISQVKMWCKTANTF